MIRYLNPMLLLKVSPTGALTWFDSAIQRVEYRFIAF